MYFDTYKLYWHERKLHAETFAKLGNKGATKNNSSPKQNDDLHFVIFEGNDVRLITAKKRRLVSVVDVSDVEKFSPDYG